MDEYKSISMSRSPNIVDYLNIIPLSYKKQNIIHLTKYVVFDWLYYGLLPLIMYTPLSSLWTLIQNYSVPTNLCQTV